MLRLLWVLVLERIRKCVIPAAGMGTRFYPLTRAQPKEMLPILDKPVIHYVVEEAVNSGLDEILIIVGAGKDSIINYFDRHKLDDRFDDYGLKNIPDIYFVRQKEQKGLADAITYGHKFTGDDNFVVLLGDTIYKSFDDHTVTSHIISEFIRLRSPIVAVEKIPKEKVIDYGVVEVEDRDRQLENYFKVKGVVEKPEISKAPSDMGITGIYAFHPEIFDYISLLSPGKNNELQLSDAINNMAVERDVFAVVINGIRYDIGSKELWYKTFMQFYKSKISERHNHLDQE